MGGLLQNVLSLVLIISLNLLQFLQADPCLTNYGGCDKRAGLCWSTSATTHFCSCKAGYKEDKIAGMHTCIDIDECREDSPCDENSICENRYGSYICHCKCGYMKDYTGQKCLDPQHVTGQCLLPKYCYHLVWWWVYRPFDVRYAKWDLVTDLRSLGHVSQSTHEDRQCKCERGFRLNPCGYCIDIDECREDNHGCTGEGHVCANTEGSYYCYCKDQFTLGPCKRRCYGPQETVPEICIKPDLSSLSSAGVNVSDATSAMNMPIILANWRSCPEDSETGNTTIVSYDLDFDWTDDVTLTWLCTNNGMSVLKNFAEDEAYWDEWTCWTECKATCWGGLQTRSRTCHHGLPGLVGCQGEGSQSRGCYNGPLCEFRIRKDARSLNEEERADLTQAMMKYKEDMTTRGFFSAAAIHGWPYMCNHRQSCCPHGAKMKFLAWHRTLVLNFEEGISRYLRDKTIGLPYWNWLSIDPSPPALAWNRFTEGDEPNPFANMTVRIDLNGPMRTIQRDQMVFPPVLQYTLSQWRQSATKMMNIHSLHEFAESLENVHGGPHVSACGSGRFQSRCSISLARITFAGFDPLFMFHHTQIDRLWAVAQKKFDDTSTTTWTTQTALEVLEESADFGRQQLPFSNWSLNNFPIIQAVNNMRDSYYYTALTGVIYDFLDNEGFPPAEDPAASQRSLGLRPAGAEQLFISHYMKNIGGESPVYCNYYMVFGETDCSFLTEFDRLGRSIILPTDRPFNNSIPKLIMLEKMGFGGMDFDFEIAACYTNESDCTSQCSPATNPGLDTLPSPGLVHYIPNQPVDVYKFNWGTGRIMPQWQINLSGSSQWVFFYGTRAHSILQVSSRQEWNSCEISYGVPFVCSDSTGGKACMLPVGIYYLIDSDDIFCKGGLRMIITSRL